MIVGAELMFLGFNDYGAARWVRVIKYIDKSLKNIPSAGFDGYHTLIRVSRDAPLSAGRYRPAVLIATVKECIECQATRVIYLCRQSSMKSGSAFPINAIDQVYYPLGMQQVSLTNPSSWWPNPGPGLGCWR